MTKPETNPFGVHDVPLNQASVSIGSRQNVGGEGHRLHPGALRGGLWSLAGAQHALPLAIDLGVRLTNLPDNLLALHSASQVLCGGM